jgi:hypothetical protein
LNDSDVGKNEIAFASRWIICRIKS